MELPGLANVYGFLGDKLGMEPVGSFAYVPAIEGFNESGRTIYYLRKAYVVRDNIFQKFGDEFSVKQEIAFNRRRALHVAAHELTHLAGTPDLVYFSVDFTSPEKPMLMNAGTTLEDWPNVRRGAYLEEGLATLTSTMYLWNVLPAGASAQDTEEFRSQEDISLHIPRRFRIVGHQPHSFCGWGIERLVELIPATWDIFMASRKYGARANVIRTALQERIDTTVPGLFEHMDKVDVKNLDEVFEVTKRIEHTANRRKV